MKLCIYCNPEKPDGEFSDEHIWPDALGGDYLPPSVWRTDDVCGRCNNLSGLYVDGSFIKSWAGAAERATGAFEYLSRASLGNAIVPLNFHGQLPEVPVSQGELAEYWSGPCGANIVHIRPADTADDWSAYAGGDPRAKKLAAGRAYLALTSDNPFWIAVSLNSFRAHFRKAQRFVTNAGVPPEWSHIVKAPDPSDPVQAQDLQVMAAVQNAAREGQSLVCRTITGKDLGTRLLAKLALAAGYKLLGQAFLATAYAAILRQGLWERDPEARKAIPVRGTGYLGDNSPFASVPMFWPGAWVLMLNHTTAGLSLSVFTPSKRAMHVLISDEGDLLRHLDPAYNEGRVWLTVPSCSVGLGPIWLPDYLAHQLGNISHPELEALNSKRCDPGLLPPCKSEDLPVLDVGRQVS